MRKAFLESAVLTSLLVSGIGCTVVNNNSPSDNGKDDNLGGSGGIATVPSTVTSTSAGGNSALASGSTTALTGGATSLGGSTGVGGIGIGGMGIGGVTATTANAGSAGTTTPINPGNLVRTLAYHQITMDTWGVDTSKGFAVNRDGTRALFDQNYNDRYNVTVVNADGTGKQVIEAVNANWIDGFALSADGSLLTYLPAGGALHIARADGLTNVQLPPPSLPVVGSPRFAKDPLNPAVWKAYFVAAAGDWNSPPEQRAIYSVNADGTGLKAILTASNVASMVAVAQNGIGILGGQAYDNTTLAVSGDGRYFVSRWGTGNCNSSYWIIGGTTDGTTNKIVWGPITAASGVTWTWCGINRLAISDDGTIVAYDIDDAEYGKREVGVIGFDGTNRRKLASINGGADNNWGISGDGSRLLANYTLYSTNGSGSFELAVSGGGWSTDPPSIVDLYLGSLSAKGDRILYVAAGGWNPRPVALVDINPTSLGLAPSITSPTILPASITRDGAAATVAAKVTAVAGTTVQRVASALMLSGAHDANCVQGDNVMLDDGTGGDQVAGDGIYTNNAIRASSCATVTGPRTVRVRAEVSDSTGKKHATVVEFAPFSVL